MIEQFIYAICTAKSTASSLKHAKLATIIADTTKLGELFVCFSAIASYMYLDTTRQSFENKL